MPNGVEVDGRAFGQLEGAVRSLAEQVQEMSDRFDELRKEVTTMQEAVQQVKGGWWVITTLAAVVAAASSAATWLFSHLQWR